MKDRLRLKNLAGVMTPTTSDAASTISENTGGAKTSLLGLTTSALSAWEAMWEEDSLDGRNHIGRSNGGISSKNGRARRQRRLGRVQG